MKTPNATGLWKDARCAHLPLEDLALLADLRGQAEVRVVLAGAAAWLCWRANSGVMPEMLARRILPVKGVELFTERGGRWYRLGEHLPAFDVPFRDGQSGVSLDSVIIPGKLRAERPRGERPEPHRVRLVRGDHEGSRQATGLRCSLRALVAWAERATSSELSSLQAAWRGAADGEAGEAAVFVLGSASALPFMPESVRYWGTDVLVPLGFRVDPDLPEPALRRMVGADGGDLVVVDEVGFELIARSAFRPLTRAGVRLAGALPKAPARRQEGIGT